MKKVLNVRGLVQDFNNKKISENEFFEKLRIAVDTIAENKKIPNKEDVVQEVCLKIFVRLQKGKVLNDTYFKWQLETEVLRYAKTPEPDIAINSVTIAYRVDLDSDIFVEDFINKVSSALTEREKMVLQKREEGYTLIEIGKMYGVQHERIRQIEAKAIRKLQRHFYFFDKS